MTASWLIEGHALVASTRTLRWWLHQRPSSGHSADRTDQLGCRLRLGDEGFSPYFERRQSSLLAIIAGDEDEPCSGLQPANCGGCVSTIAIWQPVIQQHYVGTQLGGA